MPNFGNSNADPLNPLAGLLDEIVLVLVTSSMAFILCGGGGETASLGSATRSRSVPDLTMGQGAALPNPEAPRPLDRNNMAQLLVRRNMNYCDAQYELLRCTILSQFPP